MTDCKIAAILTKILNAGGRVRTHSGNVAKRGGLHKAQVRALLVKGLVEDCYMAPIPPAVVGEGLLGVTVAGCRWLHAYRTAAAVE